MGTSVIVREEGLMPKSPDEDKKRKEFEVIALQYMDATYQMALRMAKNSNDAQDLTQETYLRAYRFFDKFEKGTSFKAWLFRILKNVYINKYRKALKKPPMDDVEKLSENGILATKTTPEDEIFNGLLNDDITKAINALPEEFRFVVILKDLEGLPYKEIAEILGCPIGTVMSRLHRGRKLLRDSLYDYAKMHGYLKIA